MVGAPGFEPGTSCAQGKRATRLRHAPKTRTHVLYLHLTIPRFCPVRQVAALLFCQSYATLSRPDLRSVPIFQQVLRLLQNQVRLSSLGPKTTCPELEAGWC